VLALFRCRRSARPQGGLEVSSGRGAAGQEITQDLDRSVAVMRERIDKLGVSEPVITRQGTDQISVQLAGVHDSGRAAEIIGQTAQLQFFDLQADALPPTAGAGGVINPSTRLLPLLSGQQEAAKAGTPTQWYLYSKDKTRLAGPSETKETSSGSSAASSRGAQTYAVTGQDRPHLHRHGDALSASGCIQGRPTTTSTSTGRTTRPSRCPS
jgi:preprotein translocase subunit SecD